MSRPDAFLVLAERIETHADVAARMFSDSLVAYGVDGDEAAWLRAWCLAELLVWRYEVLEQIARWLAAADTVH